MSFYLLSFPLRTETTGTESFFFILIIALFLTWYLTKFYPVLGTTVGTIMI